MTCRTTHQDNLLVATLLPQTQIFLKERCIIVSSKRKSLLLSCVGAIQLTAFLSSGEALASWKSRNTKYFSCDRLIEFVQKHRRTTLMTRLGSPGKYQNRYVFAVADIKLCKKEEFGVPIFANTDGGRCVITICVPPRSPSKR